MKRNYTPAGVGVSLLVIAMVGGIGEILIGRKLDDQEKRIKALEHIIGDEVPENPTWTNFHFRTTVVKHSDSCPCREAIWWNVTIEEPDRY